MAEWYTLPVIIILLLVLAACFAPKR